MLNDSVVYPLVGFQHFSRGGDAIPEPTCCIRKGFVSRRKRYPRLGGKQGKPMYVLSQDLALPLQPPSDNPRCARPRITRVHRLPRSLVGRDPRF